MDNIIFQGTVPQLLVHLGQTISMSQGRRVVILGVVKINGEVVDDLTKTFDFKSSDKIQIGKREFYVGSSSSTEEIL